MGRFLLPLRVAWLTGAALCVCTTTSPLPASDDPEVREVTHAPFLEANNKRVLQQLHLVVPEKGQQGPTTRLVDRQHVTWGELFEKGRTHAVVELQRRDTSPSLVALASWNGFQWKVEQVFELRVHRERLDFYGAPPEQPKIGKEDEGVFTTLQFAPSMAPSLVVKAEFADDPWKDYAVLHYHPAAHRISLPARVASQVPRQEDGYWIFTKDYRRKKGTQHMHSYYDVDDAKLRFRGSLHMASGGGEILSIRIGFPKDGEPEPVVWVFRTTEYDPSIYRIHRDGDNPDDLKAQLGQVKFIKPQSGSHVCAGYFLKKLASLPHTITTRRYKDNGRDVVQVPEDVPDADVLVSGNAEVRRAFLGEQVP